MVLRGRAKLGVGQRELELGPGQLVVLEPGVDHELLAASPDLELHVVAVRAELAARAPQLFGGKTELTRVPTPALQHYAQALHELGQVQGREAVEQGLLELWSSLVSFAPSSLALGRRASQALRSERALSGAELAKRLRTTPSEISRAFRSGLGLPMVQYRARLRLLEFVRRVDAGQSLTAAALDADFGSYAQCSRVFERALGCPPREYFRGARREIDERVRPSISL